MKKIILSLFILLATLAGYSSAIKNNSNIRIPMVLQPAEDGLSYETAIVIKETTEEAGVTAEYTWMKNHYPGYQMQSQSLMTNKDKPFDVMDIKLTDGSKLRLYFDISNYFGKL
jgi:hypothetical protein